MYGVTTDFRYINYTLLGLITTRDLNSLIPLEER